MAELEPTCRHLADYSKAQLVSIEILNAEN